MPCPAACMKERCSMETAVWSSGMEQWYGAVVWSSGMEYHRRKAVGRGAVSKCEKWKDGRGSKGCGRHYKQEYMTYFPREVRWLVLVFLLVNLLRVLSMMPIMLLWGQVGAEVLSWLTL
eukprot:768307-Pelagomonas_calceolata.AAC.1